MSTAPAHTYTRLAIAIVIAALVISASALSYSHFQGTTTPSTSTDIVTTTLPQLTTTSTRLTVVTSIENYTSISTETSTVTSTETLTGTTNSSIPGFVELNGVIASQIYQPTTIKFLQDECTNAQYYKQCNPCLNGDRPDPAAPTSTATNVIQPMCVQNLYSANVTIAETIQLGSNASQVTYYGNFSILLPNNYGYEIIPWFNSPSQPPGFAYDAGYFLVDTPSPSINEPGVWCDFPPNLNYSFNNEQCAIVSSAAYWFA
jgi:hypothetical protein